MGLRESRRNTRSLRPLVKDVSGWVPLFRAKTLCGNSFDIVNLVLYFEPAFIKWQKSVSTKAASSDAGQRRTNSGAGRSCLPYASITSNAQLRARSEVCALWT